jgi:hypothetical protein
MAPSRLAEGHDAPRKATTPRRCFRGVYPEVIPHGRWVSEIGSRSSNPIWIADPAAVIEWVDERSHAESGRIDKASRTYPFGSVRGAASSARSMGKPESVPHRP